MGFFDFFKKLFPKKELNPSSPSEMQAPKNVNVDGQFGAPQGTAMPQNPDSNLNPQSPVQGTGQTQDKSTV